MRKLVLISLGLILSVVSQAQEDDKSGTSNSFLYKNGAARYDITEKEISFGYNNLDKIYTDKKGTVWGLLLKGKNDNNNATIISKDNFSSQGKIDFFKGWYDVTEDLARDKINELEEKERKLIENQDKNIKDYTDFVKPIIKELAIKDSTELIKILNKENIYFINRIDPSSFKDSANVKKLLDKLDSKNRMISVHKAYNESLTKVRNELNEFKTSKERDPYRMNMFFLRLSAYGQSFHHYSSIDTSNYFNSFKSKSFTGYSIGAGYQFSIKNIDFTLSYNYLLANNLNNLSKKTFNIHEELFNTDSTQKLIKDKEYIAYSGDYKIFNFQQLSLDAVIYQPIETKMVAVINPYVIANFAYDDGMKTPNYFNFGIKMYLFKDEGSLIGGFYIEALDVTNQIEKQKDDPELEPLYKRLTIGLSVSYQLTDIIKNFKRYN